jgi:galactosyl transferase GMA12/MNN10 family
MKSWGTVNIAILTLATSHIASYSELSFKNKLYYAQRHGYDFYHYTSVLDPARPPAWSKILIIQKHLPDYDWTFWTDADSLIMNQSIKLEHFISRATSHDMIVTLGPRDRYNTGQWLVRSCDWSAALLRKLWNEVEPNDPWYWGNPWEQRALAELVKRSPDLADRICVLPMREMNSRPKSAYVDLCPELNEIDYRRGDFIVHFYHTKDPTLRLRGMKDYYDKWIDIGLHLKQGEIVSNADSFDGGYKWAARITSKGGG